MYKKSFISRPNKVQCGFLLMLFILIGGHGFAQEKTLDYFLQQAIQSSPLLKSYRNQVLINKIDSSRLIASNGFKVDLISNNLYAPVIKGWGYDAAITNITNVNALLSVSREIIGKNNLKNQIQGIGFRSQSASNSAKVTEQELKTTVTNQYITVFSSYQQYIFDNELLDLLSKEEILIKKLTEQGVYKQTEYLSFLVNLSQQKLVVTQQKYQFKNDLANLNYLCGIIDTTFVVIAQPDLNLEIQPELSATVFYHQFELDSMILKNSDRQIDFEYKPKFSIFADGGYNSSLASDPWKNFGVSAGFNFSLPIYDGNQRKMQHTQKAIEEDTRVGYRNYFTKQYSQQINLLLQKLDANRNMSSQFQTQIDYTKTLVEANSKLINTADITIADYFLAINNYINAKNMLLQNNIEKYQIINEINYWNRPK